MRRAPRCRAVALGAVVALALVLSGCDEASVQHPSATPTPSAVATLPPIGFNHRFGTNPVAAADAFTLERTLFAQRSFWEVAMSTSPQQAGYVTMSDLSAVGTARSKATSLVFTIATEYSGLIHDFIANGDDYQRQYCIGLLDKVRALGYGSLEKVTMYIFFTEQDEHAMLSWTPADGYSFKVLDNDLRGTRINPSPSSTPFANAPAH